MKYRMIVSDYGETLVHTGESVNVRNIDAIHDYQKQGGIFCIATGREWSSIYQKLQKSDFKRLCEMPVICFYGAAAVLSKTKKILFEKVLDKLLLNRITSFFDRSDMPYSLVSINKIFSTCEVNSEELPWKRHSEHYVFKTREQMLRHINKKNINILKVEVYGAKNISKVIDFFETDMPDCFKYFPCNNAFIEIISADSGKGKAVEFLSNYYNILIEDLIVVGDAPNDFEMFNVAINKYAVSNAIDSIIAASNSIIDNSNYLGISLLIRDIMEGS